MVLVLPGMVIRQSQVAASLRSRLLQPNWPGRYGNNG
jgi:hypothetical protein